VSILVREISVAPSAAEYNAVTVAASRVRSDAGTVLGRKFVCRLSVVSRATVISKANQTGTIAREEAQRCG
jgi:hypothetical protein